MRRLIVLAALVAASCGPVPSGPSAASKSSAAEPQIPMDGPPNGAWRYSSKTDEMSGHVSEFACVNAEERLEADPPYESARPELCLSRSEGDTSLPTLDLHGAGRIDCDRCTVRVKLQGGELHWAYSQGVPGESVDYMDLWDGTVSKLVAQGGVLWIEVPRLNDRPIVRFKVRGAPWPRPGEAAAKP